MGPAGWARRSTGLAAIWLGLAGPAAAGAWPAPVGHGQVIVKLEEETATLGLDGSGQTLAIPRQTLTFIDLYADYGLTPDLSLQVTAGLERSRLGVRQVDGAGPCSLGVRYVLARPWGGFLTAYAGATTPAADQATRSDPAAGQAGGELRLLAGRSFRVFGRDLFAEAETARLLGGGHENQTRIDGTLGIQLRPRLLLLSQVYSGRQEGGASGASWVKLDESVVRTFGAWRAQLGWRRTLAGRNLPVTTGPVIGLWRRY